MRIRGVSSPNLTLFTVSEALAERLAAAGWTPPAMVTDSKGRPTPRAPQNRPQWGEPTRRYDNIDHAASNARAALLAGLELVEADGSEDTVAGREAAASWLAIARNALHRGNPRAGP